MIPSTERIPSAEERMRADRQCGVARWLEALGVSLAAALLMVAPFYWLGTPSGHDIGFHAPSWLDAAGQWREGILYPRWAEWANHGFGEPRFIFYPPLSWMLGAALGFALPWNAVPTILILLVQTIAGICAFALARRVLSEGASRFAAFCYAANPYALLVVYLRGDFAEQLASALFPLLILVIFELTGTLESRRSAARNLAFFATLFALVWLSNAPAGVLASYFIAVLLAWSAVAEKSWKPLALGAAGLAMGFGLSAIYLLPAAYEQRWVNIRQALSTGLLPRENFLFTQTNDPEHTLFNWVASSTAVVMIVLTGLAALAAWRRSRSEADLEAKKFFAALLLLSAAATVLMLRFTGIFWNLLPELRFLQFPWRWMCVLAVPLAVFLGAVIDRHRYRWLMIAGATAIFAGTGALQASQGWWDGEDLPAAQAWIEQGDGYDGTDEYDPAGDDHTDLPAKVPRAYLVNQAGQREDMTSGTISVEKWTAEEKRVRVETRKPMHIALRLVDYPAWRVEVNGKSVLPEHPEGTRQIIVPLASGESRILVRFMRTWDRRAGGAISLASVLVVVFLATRKAADLRIAQQDQRRSTVG